MGVEHRSIGLSPLTPESRRNDAMNNTDSENDLNQDTQTTALSPNKSMPRSEEASIAQNGTVVNPDAVSGETPMNIEQ